MKLRRTLRFHGLKKPRVRQTWNKYNLYNLANDRPILNTIGAQVKTFFQQKWAAKRIARGYHGEHIKERAWERMFDRRLLSVVNMEPRYMARYDGSEQASGRGQGRKGMPPAPGGGTDILEKQRGSGRKTPYMQMAFAPMERRLDIAVFRALFASSARQARQFVVHGAVRVNGKRMKYPGYLLNPGDMFQVDPERVLFATGAKKNPAAVETPAEEDSEATAEATTEADASSSPAAEGSSESAPEAAAAEASSAETSAAAAESTEPAASTPEDPAKAERAELKALRDRVKTFLKTSFGDLSAKQKQALRSLTKDIRTAMSRTKGAGEDVDGLSTLFSQLEMSSSASAEPDDRNDPDAVVDGRGLTRSERERLAELLAEESENPWDPDKPYATPWRPRPFMSPFAFIPRYLEVNQKVCSAVYLRHPVARAGKAEVPSPWGEMVNELAFNWYLRRR